MARKNRRRSWGSISSLTKTRHVVRWIENTPEGRRRKSKTIEGTFKQADRFLAEKRIETESPPTATVGEIWRDYEQPLLQERLESGKLSKATMRQYESSWKSFVSPKWGKTPVTEVRPLDIQRWLLTMSNASSKIARVVLKKTLDTAVMFEMIPANPADKKFRFTDPDRKESGVYTEEQLRTIADIVRGTVCEVPFLLSARAGLRVGEACCVAIDDVRFDHNVAVIKVRHQLTETGDVTTRLKTTTSTRTVGLPEPWCARLREIVGNLPPQAVWTNDNGAGEPSARYTVAKNWEALIKDSDLTYLPMQTLRPAFETIMHWRAGIPIEQVARIMGHKQASTTINHYDRPGGEELVSVTVDAAKRLSKIS